MIKNKLSLFALFVLLPLFGQAQWALTATGTSMGAVGGNSYAYSVGEIFTTPIGEPCTTDYYLTGVIQSSSGCIDIAVNDIFDEEYYLKCYPNPATESIVIETDFPDFRRYLITNTIGQTTASGMYDRPEIDLTMLPPGIYLVTLFSDDQKIYKSFKIIKQ